MRARKFITKEAAKNINFLLGLGVPLTKITTQFKISRPTLLNLLANPEYPTWLDETGTAVQEEPVDG